MTMRLRRPRAILAAASMCLVCSFVSDAHAGALAATATDCASVDLTQPFAALGDQASYFMVPGGDFESGTPGWSVSRAAVVDGNDPYLPGTHSLEISSGGAATTPVVCVGIDEPSLRFATRKRSGLLTTLLVSVRFVGPLGTPVQLPIGSVVPTDGWQAPSQMIVANLLPLVDGNRTPVQFVFSAVGGAWNIDDVYVDPYRKG
jgi:hypothetical protein